MSGALAFAAAACAVGEQPGFEEVEEQAGPVPVGGKADSLAGPIVVTEIGDAFVEVRNDGDQPIDLAGFLVSFSYRRVRLEPHAGQSSIVPAGGLALIVDAGEALPARLAATTPVVDTSQGIRELLAYSKSLIVRTPERIVTDRADARAWSSAAVAIERQDEATWALSALGHTPGARNGVHDAGAIRPLFALAAGDDNPLPGELAAFIRGAGDTIDAALYQLDHPVVVDALVDAAARGVTVRIATDSDYLGDPDYAHAYSALAAAGIAVVGDQRSARQHNKFVAVDGRRVWVGSYNPVSPGGYGVADDVLVMESPALAAAHIAEVDEMFGGKFGPHKNPGRGHEAHVDGSRVELYFAPTDDAKSAILDAIASADTSIYFSQFAFYDADIANAMMDRAALGVDVRGLFDRRSASSVSQYDDLVGAGLDVRRPFYDVMLHHKLIVIDYAGSDPIAITGSYNLSNTAANNNDESVVIVHDGYVARAYYDAWRRTYEQASGPNTDTEMQVPLAVTEVFAGDEGFVELANLDSEPVELAGLELRDRDGNRLALAGTVPASGRAVVSAQGLGLGHDDALVVFDSRRRLVTTFDHPRYAGQDHSLERLDLAVPDLDAPWQPSSAAGGTPGY